MTVLRCSDSFVSSTKIAERVSCSVHKLDTQPATGSDSEAASLRLPLPLAVAVPLAEALALCHCSLRLPLAVRGTVPLAVPFKFWARVRAPRARQASTLARTRPGVVIRVRLGVKGTDSELPRQTVPRAPGAESPALQVTRPSKRVRQPYY